MGGFTRNLVWETYHVRFRARLSCINRFRLDISKITVCVTRNPLVARCVFYLRSCVLILYILFVCQGATFDGFRTFGSCQYNLRSRSTSKPGFTSGIRAFVLDSAWFLG